MPNFPIRFTRGSGLQRSSADKTQLGFLEMQNADMEQSNVIAKRRGYQLIPRTTTETPTLEFPGADTRAVFHRVGEPLLESLNTLYSRRLCAGEGEVPLGTATQPEIDLALSTLDDRLATEYSVDVTLAGSGSVTGNALNRIDRIQEAFDTKNYQTGGKIIPAFLRFESGDLVLRWQGGDVTTPGAYVFPRPGPGNPRHYVNVSAGKVWFGHTTSGNRCVVSRYTVTATLVPSPGLQVTLDQSFVNIIGPAASCAYDGNITYQLGLSDSGGGVIVLRNDTQTWPVPPASAALIDAADSILFDVQYSVSNGIRAAFALDDAGFDGNTYYLAYTTTPGTAATLEEAFAQGDVNYGASDILGVAFDNTRDVVASRMLALDNVDITRKYISAARWDFDSVANTGLHFEYKPLAGDYTKRVLVDDEVFSTEVLVASAQPAPEDVRLVSAPDGRHLVGVRAPTGSLRLFALAVAGEVDTTEIVPPTDSVAFDVARDASENDVWVATYLDDNLEHVIRYGALGALSTRALALIPGIPVNQQGSALTTSIAYVGPANFNIRVTQWYSQATSPNYQTLRSYSWNSAADLVSLQRDDGIATVTLASAAHVQLGAYPRILWAVENQADGVRQVFELDTDLFVRVFPGVAGLPGGDWAVRGPWTRGQLRELQTQDWNTTIVREVSGAFVRSLSALSESDRCYLQLLSLDDGTQPRIQALVYSSHTESGGVTDPVQLDPGAAGPHVSAAGEEHLALYYVLSDAKLVSQVWQPGTGILLADTGTTMLSATNPVYDTDGAATDGIPYHGYIAVRADNSTLIEARDEDNVVFASAALTVTGGPAEAVAIYTPQDGTSNSATYWVIAQAVTIAGGYRLRLSALQLFFAGGVQVLTNIQTDVGVAGQEVRAITVGTTGPIAAGTGGVVSVEVYDPATLELQVDTYTWDSIQVVNIRKDARSAIAGSYREVNKQLTHWQTSIDTTQDKSKRSGLFGVSPLTGEITTRTAFGFTEDATARALRTQVSDTNTFLDIVALSYTVETGAVEDTQTASAFFTWDVTPRANKPAVLQNVLVSAHAGYGRAYDGANIFEHGWHELPQIVSVTGIAGTLPNGLYQVAVAFEWYDGFGNLYRSAPAFSSIDVTTGGFRVVTRPLQRSERRNVNIVCYHSLLDGAVYYRAARASAGVFTNPTFDFTAVVATLGSEPTLDQIDGGVLPSEPERVTDFIAAADFRLWSRDPAQGALLKFTIPATQGNAPHWPFIHGIEFSSPHDVRSLHEQDGRLIALTSHSVYSFSGGGPSSFGEGSYASPSNVPIANGAIAHTAVAQLPDGLAAGTTRSPLLLTRGLSTQDQLFEPISAVYEEEGELLELALWLPASGELLALNRSPGTAFRWHRATNRWSQESYTAVDASVSTTQDVLLLATDGQVLFQPLIDDNNYQDGGVSFELSVSTPWLHEPNQSGLVHGGYDFIGFTVTGAYRGPHSLTAEVYLDYKPTPSYTAVVPASRLASDFANNRPYVYFWRLADGGIHCHSVRVRLTDGVAVGESFSVEAIDVIYATNQSTGEYQFPDEQGFDTL